ncbi:MAG: hypothetical protein LUK37_27175 [Clostridia bacterium]|nr:hypothetical protein [Clostridia bacterium]
MIRKLRDEDINRVADIWLAISFTALKLSFQYFAEIKSWAFTLVKIPEKKNMQ